MGSFGHSSGTERSWDIGSVIYVTMQRKCYISGVYELYKTCAMEIGMKSSHSTLNNCVYIPGWKGSHECDMNTWEIRKNWHASHIIMCVIIRFTSQHTTFMPIR